MGKTRLPTWIHRREESRDRPTTPRLRVLVRPDTYLVRTDRDDQRQLCRRIAGELWAFVGVDEGDAIGFPSLSELESETGLDEEAIWSIALRNSPGAGPLLHVPAPDVIQPFTCEEGEATSCLADEDLWCRMDQEAEHGLLVLPLEKNVLFVIGSFKPASALALPQLVEIAAASPEYLSPVVLTRRDGRWIVACDIDPAFAAATFKH